MKTANWLQNASDKLSQMVKDSHPRPIDLTIEEKETQCRLNGWALMWQGGNLYAMNVGAAKDPGNPPKGWYKHLGFTTAFRLLSNEPPLLIKATWGQIHRANAFNSLKS